MKQYGWSPERPRRRFVENRGSIDDAREIRRTFQDREPSKVQTFRWKWPRRMVEVGTCEAVMYSSDKWRDDGVSVDYKHVAEGPQTLLVVPGFLRDFHSPRTQLDVPGRVVDLNGEMPDAFAVLARILGLQARLFVDDGDGDLYLPNGDETLYQVDVANAWLGAAKHPETGEKFLIVYTEAGGVCAIVTGEILDVKRDGIVG